MFLTWCSAGIAGINKTISIQKITDTKDITCMFLLSIPQLRMTYN